MKAKKDNAGPTMQAIEDWLIKQVDAQLPKSVEFKCSQFRIYLRAGRRLEPEGRTFIPAISVASIDVAARLRGNGFFRTLLSWLENRATALGYFAVFVDQVNSEILQQSLPRNGYTRVASTDALEYIFWKPVTPVGAVPPATEDETVCAIYDGANKTYITALVGPNIRSDAEIQKAMLIKGRPLAHEVRDSLRGPQSTRYTVVQVEGEPA